MLSTSNDTLTTRVDEYIHAQMATHHIPGLSLAVTHEGVPVLTKGYGLANVELEVPCGPDSVYEIASVTKVFTATAVMMLVRDGLVDLDIDVHEYLPHLSSAWRGATIRRILRHTSGIPNYTDVPAYWKTTRLDISREEIMALVLDAPLDFTPGSNWRYSNTGYYVLGLLVEKVSGKPYADFLQERIFVPLGMSSTRANDPAAIVPGRVSGYVWQGEHLRNAEYYSPSGTYAAGVLLSTVSDLAKWDAALYTDTLLPQEWLRQMWTPEEPVTGGEQKFGFRMGLAWYLFDYKGARVMRHAGGIKGFASELDRFYDDRIGIILLHNLENGPRPDYITNGIADLVVPSIAASYNGASA
jgi:D-alanyl-D-alanine carboxypeptidase